MSIVCIHVIMKVEFPHNYYEPQAVCALLTKLGLKQNPEEHQIGGTPFPTELH